MRGPIPDGEITDEKPLLANVFNVQNLSNTSKTKRLQEGWREQTQSIFASVEIGFKNTYFLTLTGRNDWPSQLAGPNSVNSSFFYLLKLCLLVRIQCFFWFFSRISPESFIA